MNRYQDVVDCRFDDEEKRTLNKNLTQACKHMLFFQPWLTPYTYTSKHTYSYTYRNAHQVKIGWLTMVRFESDDTHWYLCVLLTASIIAYCLSCKIQFEQKETFDPDLIHLLSLVKITQAEKFTSYLPQVGSALLKINYAW